MTKYGLALHTTSPDLGLAIANFAGDIRSSTWELGLDLSSYLHQYLKEFLQPQTWSDLGFIAVAKGPGSFTATRIGVVTARTLAQQLDIPLFAISSLKAVAFSEKEKCQDGEAIAVQMQARRGQLFVAIYQPSTDGMGLKEYLPDTTTTPEKWQQTLDNLEMSYKLIETPVNLGNTVISLLELAYLDRQQGKCPDWSQALPFYGQHPVQ
ncbi:MAG: tRNA (adenosine(37)-N6)-threonylcarbamoyltransferase complex dimerization subunit type 1 TsaB [Prochloraceae cyanobacterium]|nr:tRNA (adenosine(37)-N6)-threonylcarbamoyltransferase complex dimerization subunit type 1 TsaB [Prochloraceae cyanobacterium]